MSVIKTLLLLLALLCAFHPSPLCEAAVCYVKPAESHNATCPSEPCHTLDEYVRNSTRYFVSNTVFMFLTGHHNLSYNLTVSNVHNITLRPYIMKSNIIISSEFISSESLILMFELSSDIVIRGLTLQSISMLFFIRLEECMNITLTGLRAEKGTALILSNVFGAVNISHLRCATNFSFCIEFERTVTQPQNITKLSTLVLLHNLDSRGAGILISGCIPGKTILMNSTFTGNENGVELRLGPSCCNMLFVSENNLFHKNTWGLNITVPTSQQDHKQSVAIVLHNVSYIDHAISIFLHNVQNLTISNCYFQGSQHGAIVGINSVLSFTGNVTFIDNHNINSINTKGGAISLLGDSHILITEPNNTYVLFENNTSDDVGGAIYYSTADPYETGCCKIFVEQTSRKTVFNFTMNFAVNGGNAIYGAYLDAIPCYSPNGSLVHNLSEVFLSVSSFSPPFTNDLQSIISSDAQDLCFCDRHGSCLTIQEESKPWSQISVYPGQIFSVSVAAFGDMKGHVKWQVNARVLAPDRLGNNLQEIQTTGAECTELQYSILSKNNASNLYLTLQTSYITHYGHFHSINLLNCPLGFVLNTSDYYGCKCHNFLVESIESITCNITDQSIERHGTTWIGVLEHTNNTTLAFSNVCPFLYCKKANVKVYVNESSLLNENIQCTDNRSGVLCGSCRDNFSLALGSNRCLHGCSNNSISLIIAFAAAGIALVIFIKVLNLTVSQGTINGFILYANIVGVEQSVLFSTRAYEGFLAIFLAWANFDFGIETCFFDGMDAYAKAWLQFIFPVYVWAIALFIIILSHYSIRASKLFGNNSVPVLATLILLSYSKLLRAVISALSVTQLKFLNGSTMSVWERDGNIQYLTGKHMPLFVFAVTVLIVLWFPFTLVLVSIQWLQKGTHFRVLCWVTKLRPFFDAFTGPLEFKHRYWVGTLLLARCSLLLIIYIYTANGSGVAIVSIMFAVVFILVYLAATGSVYRNYYITVLELSYILNLGILATGSIYVQYVNMKGNHEALLTTSVGIAFLQFMATVIYHAYIQLREPLKKFQIMATVIYRVEEKLNKLKVKILNLMCGKENTENINELEHREYEPLAGASYSEEPLLRSPFSNFREPLLGYLSN